MVDAPEVFQHAIGAPARQVTGAIQARARHSAIGIGDEAFGSQRGATMVTTRQAVAADVQLTSNAGRRRLQRLVEDVQLGIGDGLAEQRAGATFDLPGGRPDGGLGRPVEVPQRLGLRGQRIGQFRRQCFAAAEEAAIAQARKVFMAAEQGPGAWSRLDHRDALLQRGAEQARRIARDVTVDQHHAGADQQRQVQLQGRDVEGQRGQRQHPITGGHAGCLSHAQHEVDHPAMAHGDALGFTGGAGGVDHIGQVIGAGQVGQIVFGVTVQTRPIAVQAEGEAVDCRQFAEQVLLGQQQFHPAVFEHVRQAFAGEFRVQRHIGATGLEHRQQRHRQFH
ncbi:MAG: hypothetical protein GAK45_00171 [Pseudomonas citronellolis]|nr:MAG: hypothetical protein GAK45_00171 [Pseudomonas citronellolis]